MILRSRQIIKLSVLSLLCAFEVAAQEKAAPRFLRLLPLGDQPPFRQEIREDARYEVDPEPGTVPPPVVLVPGSEGGVSERVALRLGTPSLPLLLPPGNEAGSVVMRDADEKSWARISFVAEGSTLALLWRGGQLWDEVRSLPIPDGREAFAANSCRFVNVAAVPVGISWNQEQRKLAPGQVLVIPFTQDQVPLEIYSPGSDGTPQLFFATLVEKSELLAQQFFIYRADGVEVRQPLKVLFWKELR